MKGRKSNKRKDSKNNKRKSRKSSKRNKRKSNKSNKSNKRKSNESVNDSINHTIDILKNMVIKDAGTEKNIDKIARKINTDARKIAKYNKTEIKPIQMKLINTLNKTLKSC